VSIVKVESDIKYTNLSCGFNQAASMTTIGIEGASFRKE
jgi:hypothetical protein